MPRHLKIEATTPIVFNLPYVVALEQGFFLDEDLDVELVGPQGHGFDQRGPLELVEDHRTESSFGNFSGFEAGDTAMYRACEWGQIRRSYDSGRDGRVIAKRAAVASQAIIVRPDSPVVVPQDLAGVPVGVSFHHGSHYLALQALEGFLPKDEIRVVGIKGLNRFRALRDGHVDAVAVMERNRAVARAVTLINADITPHLHHFIAEVPADIVELEPADFRPNRLRYIDPAPYPERAFERTYDWMVSWGLIDANAGFEQLVDNRVVLVG